MAPRETEDNAYAKFWGDRQRALWYVMVFSGVVSTGQILGCSVISHLKPLPIVYLLQLSFPFNFCKENSKYQIVDESEKIILFSWLLLAHFSFFFLTFLYLPGPSCSKGGYCYPPFKSLSNKYHSYWFP